MSRWLVAAGVYNLLWGAIVILFPNLLFDFAEMEPPRYPQLWQCIGMIVGVYGIGYLAAAADPCRHWPIVLVGLLGKIFGPIGFLMAIINNELPPAFGVTILTNDLLWWVPFSLILWHAARHNAGRLSSGAHADNAEVLPEADALERFEAVSPEGARTTLADLSRAHDVVLVMVRHFGCTFCKEALADLARTEHDRHTLVIGHMADERRGREYLDAYDLDDAHQVSDPDVILYRSLGLRRGSFLELFGHRTIIRGALAFARGHGVGRLEGDGFQMPGVFRIRDGRVIDAHPMNSAAEPIAACSIFSAPADQPAPQ